MKQQIAEIVKNGFTLLKSIFCEEELQRMRSGIQQSLDQQTEAVRKRDGSVYAARNVLTLYPAAKTIWAGIATFACSASGSGAELRIGTRVIL